MPKAAEVVHARDLDEAWTAEGCYITEAWNREADSSLSVARARVRRGESTRPHAVEATVERYLLVAGSGVMHVEGLEPAAVGPGDLVLIPEGAVQWIENTGATDLVFYAICTPRFTPSAYRDRPLDR